VNSPAPATTNRPTKRAGAGDGFKASRHRQDDAPAGLISLRVIRGALRRRAWLVCAAALAGLAVSGWLYVAAPTAYEAATSIMITHDPNLDPGTQMQGDVKLAQSLQVASLAVRKLGIQQSVPSFARSYTVLSLTDRLLQITASASSASEAERRANAVAQEFMRYRGQELGEEQQVDVPWLKAQITAKAAQLATIYQDTKKAKAQPSSPATVTYLKTLAKETKDLNSALGALQYDVTNYPVLTLSMTKGTAVLDPAVPIPPSRRHLALIDGVAGLLAGLTLGLGVVLVEAVLSDRLRRRRDIARALGAPVDFAVGKVRKAGWLPGRRGPVAARGGNVAQLVAYLRSKVRDGGENAALAVVAVDDAEVVALALVRLATSCAREGSRVVLADLAEGAPAARLLGINDPGIHPAGADGTKVIVAVPERNDRTPIGPIRAAALQAPSVRPDKALAAACASADLLVTLATLDPALGAEHLATWTTDVVVVVTAGQSTASRLNSTGGIIRMAGTRLISAALIGADKSDDSLGTRPALPRLRPRTHLAGTRQSVSRQSVSA
jgi:capsular polysaccharide biosynthesis protein